MMRVAGDNSTEGTDAGGYSLWSEGSTGSRVFGSLDSGGAKPKKQVRVSCLFVCKILIPHSFLHKNGFCMILD